VAPDRALVDKICKMEGPLNFEQSRSFIGMTTLYRRFMFKLSHVLRPLREAVIAATGSNHREVRGKFKWMEGCGRMLTSFPIHRLPDPTKPFELYTDVLLGAFSVSATMMMGSVCSAVRFSGAITIAAQLEHNREGGLCCGSLRAQVRALSG
jgi:hypothetical protein